MSYLFHIEQFMPAAYSQPIFEGKLKYSRHALKEAEGDKFGSITLPAFFKAADAKLIEVEFDEKEGTVVKQLWRQNLDDTRDILLAIGKDGFVRTVWVNLQSDVHRTLNKSKYVRRKSF